MAKQIADEEDRLKRQARRRLIGAVALTTAVVVILPMVLDREPRPTGQNIELRIPDKDKAGEFAPKIDVPPASAVAPVSAVPAAASAVAPPAPVASAVAAAPVAAPVTPPPAAVPEPKPAAPAPKAAETKPVPVPAPKAAETKPAPAPAKPAAPEAKPEPAKQPPKAEPPKADAKAKPEAKAEHAKPEAKKESGSAKNPAKVTGFVIQIGAFNNSDTASSWAKNLKSQGFKAYTEKAGAKVRVRVGPYSTREAANAARKKIEKSQGLHSNIVELN